MPVIHFSAIFNNFRFDFFLKSSEIYEATVCTFKYVSFQFELRMS